jgi:predicted SAM-dependent methyltransferase
MKVISKLPYINLGCGYRFHQDWTNVDFIKTNENVIAHNLTQGIPFEDNTFALAYHSHVLEHFTRTGAVAFIRECYRILQPEGVIRIAIPDLEQIVKEYLHNFEKSLAGDAEAQKNYEWSMLELYDQTVRNETGGDMKKFLTSPSLSNKDYILKRLGKEAEHIFEKAEIQETLTQKLRKHSLSLIWSEGIRHLLKFIGFDNTNIGRFRTGGEIHQWMYDRYSLKKLLEECGFRDVKVQTAFSSYVNDWAGFNLDANDKGEVNKPDSLFIEAKK